MTDTPPNLEKDTTLCLAFLIANQKEWEPRIQIIQGRRNVSVPAILIGVTTDGKGVVAPGRT